MLVVPSLATMAQSLSPDTLSVSINFRQGYSRFEPDFMGNREALDRFVKAYNSHPHKASVIYIIGYASPEGSVAINQQLSRKRAEVITDYLQTHCNISADSIVSVPIGVDWPDLYTAVLADPKVPEREKVLDILTNVQDIVRNSHGVLISRRNWLLERLAGGRTWRYLLENIYPHLRGAKAEVVCMVDNVPVAPDSATTDRIAEPPGVSVETDTLPPPTTCSSRTQPATA